MQKFIGGIGCFWDETKYEGTPGVISTECGYCGGKSPQSEVMNRFVEVIQNM